MVAWRYEISLLVLKNIIHSFAVLTREIFFNTQREILYLRAAMEYPLFLNYICTFSIFFKPSSSLLSIILK